MCPCRAFLGISLFFLEMWDRLRPKHPENYKNPNIWRGKKKGIRKMLGRGTLNTCATFQGPYLKNGVDIGL